MAEIVVVTDEWKEEGVEKEGRAARLSTARTAARAVHDNTLRLCSQSRDLMWRCLPRPTSSRFGSKG